MLNINNESLGEKWLHLIRREREILAKNVSIKSQSNRSTLTRTKGRKNEYFNYWENVRYRYYPKNYFQKIPNTNTESKSKVTSALSVYGNSQSPNPLKTSNETPNSLDVAATHEQYNC